MWYRNKIKLKLFLNYRILVEVFTMRKFFLIIVLFIATFQQHAVALTLDELNAGAKEFGGKAKGYITTFLGAAASGSLWMAKSSWSMAKSSGFHIKNSAIGNKKLLAKATISLGGIGAVVWAGKELGLGLGYENLLSCAQDALFLGASASAIYGYKWMRHWWQLSAIEKRIENAMNNGKDKHFLFATWRYNDTDFDRPIKYPSEIKTEKDFIISTMKNDISLSDKIYIYDEAGNRVNTNDITIGKLREALIKEEEMLKKWISLVAQFGDMGEKFIQLAISKIDTKVDQNDLLSSYYNEIQKIVHYGIMFFDMGQALITTAKKDFFKDNHDSSILYKPSYNPLGWVIAPWPQKSKKLFWDLIFLYARLKAIKDIVDNSAFADEVEKTEHNKSLTLKEIISDPGFEKNLNVTANIE
jgi:hypothetical protein